MNGYNPLHLFLLSLAFIFCANVPNLAFGYATASTSVFPISPTHSFSRNILQWTPGGTQTPAGTVECPVPMVTISTTQNTTISTFNYVNGVTKNWNNLPDGRNRSRNAIKIPPKYGQFCETLQTALQWQ